MGQQELGATAEQTTGQKAGIAPRVLDTGRGKACRRGGDRPGKRPRSGAHCNSASFSAWSAAISGSISSSNASPVNTRSSLQSVRLIRWSVTRPRGTLYVRAIGRAHVRTPVHNLYLVHPLRLDTT